MHQLAYRPSVQHVIDRTSGWRGYDGQERRSKRWATGTYFGIVKSVNQVGYQSRQMRLDGINTPYDENPAMAMSERARETSGGAN